MDKIMRAAGAHRVSDAAKEALAEVLEKHAMEIAAEASKFAQHAGRKTVTDKDITLAAEK
ncbi:histone [archaeon]|nr:histone [archaeon]MBT6762166.1 histone [archaeon]